MAACFPAPDTRALLVTIMCVLAACISAQAPYTLPPLPYAFNALEPLIDTLTMTLHHNRHHNASVIALNAALRQVSPAISNLPLTTLLHQLGSSSFSTLPSNVSTALRNHGGSHFNHAAFWKVLRPTHMDSHKYPNTRSKALNKAIYKAFGNLTALNAAFSTAASKVFGSGWTWLCYFPGTKTLGVVSTPNQDNPLMAHLVMPEQRCTPILGIDVWEHAYYLKHQNLRNDYIAAFWQLINWPRVSANYANAVNGDFAYLWK